jgi:L-aminoadipate-semialdehyde dehydrogenase
MRPLLDKLQISATNDGLFARGWKPGRGQALTSMNPTTGQPIATVTMATAEQSDEAVTAAAAAFETWRTRPAPKRGDLTRDLGAALREMKEPLGDLVTLEMGKIRAEGHGEVQEMIDICDFAVGLSRQLYGLTLASERPGHRMMEQWHPLGPIGVITAFNFPVAVWAWNAAIAAVCGDPVVWKPAEATPLCAIAVQKIAERVMRDHDADGLFGLVIGTGPTVGERLLQDRRLPLISFTGSTAVGRHVARTVSERFGRSILELGGNNAIVVTEDARLDLALRAIVFGSVGTAGQRCTTTRRLIVDKKVAEPLTAKLKRAYEQVPMGDPLDNGTLMGPLVSEAAVDGMMKAIDQAKADGGVVVTGGRRRPDVGPFFVEPTIIRMPGQTDVVKRETFAPILYVMDYDTFDQAMTMHNDVPQGLSSAIFTESMRVAEAFLSARGSD